MNARSTAIRAALADPSHPLHGAIVKYATGDLPRTECVRLELHLQTCETCQAEVRAIEETEGRRMCLLPGAPLSAQARQRVLDQIDTDPERRLH